MDYLTYEAAVGIMKTQILTGDAKQLISWPTKLLPKVGQTANRKSILLVKLSVFLLHLIKYLLCG